ncbi:TraB/TrbI/VirB10 family type IV secretion system protein [Candidatus Trichorickettsia mobilis]|uniref:TrbI/VirB10 family protein n=1 Tax=Candidatus Trichorickettsia mobilis TaxID=1346319 RepID=UPI00292F22EE|nr:TrbI/VirB10 family protein [Candidatus Trichorickettsia mobilis]
MAEQTTSEVKTERAGAKPEVQQELSKVAANPKQSLLILVGICGIFGYLIFNLFINKTSTTTEQPITAPTQVSKPVESKASDAPKIPQLPDLPKLITPKEAPPPPPPPPPPKLEEPPSPMPMPEVVPAKVETPILESMLPPKLVDNADAQKRKEAKRKSTIILVAGAGSKKTSEQLQQEVDFTERGAMEFVLGRGKIIDAVLETAISSDIGGEVRAVISRDVFAEGAKVILIPKGTRVFGIYEIGIMDGSYGRILIQWNRIDLASGYTINLQLTPIVDGLGRQGIQGRVDNKYKEQFSNAILMSAFNIAIANALDKIVAPPISSQANATNTAAATAIQNILSTVSGSNLDAASKVIQICAQTQAAISDKTSSAYTSMTQACTSIQSTTGATPEQKLASITSSANAAVASLLTTTASSATTTQAQDASKQAFTDVTDTFKTMVTQQKFKPTTTIDQGTLVKIYVNRDYKFPKAALKKSRLIK